MASRLFSHRLVGCPSCLWQSWAGRHQAVGSVVGSGACWISPVRAGPTPYCRPRLCACRQAPCVPWSPQVQGHLAGRERRLAHGACLPAGPGSGVTHGPAAAPGAYSAVPVAKGQCGGPSPQAGSQRPAPHLSFSGPHKEKQESCSTQPSLGPVPLAHLWGPQARDGHSRFQGGHQPGLEGRWGVAGSHSAGQPAWRGPLRPSKLGWLLAAG